MANDNLQKNMTSGGRIRKKKTGFTQVQNTVARDENISLKAKGMYLLIQSYITLEDFDIYKGFLMSMCKEKETAFESTWNELKKSGYLKQFRIVDKNNKGKIVWEYELLDEPDLTTPAIQTVIVEKENDGQEVLGILDCDHTPENMGSGENDHIPENPPYGDSMACNMDSMDIGGDINNTDIIYTDMSNTIINKTTTTTSSYSKELDYCIHSYVDNFGKKPNPAEIKTMNKYEKLIGMTDVVYGIEVAACKGKGFDYSIGVYMNLFKDTRKDHLR